MDPTSTEMSVDYDPITGRSLRPRSAPQSPVVNSSPRPFRGCDTHDKLRERPPPKKAGSKLDRTSGNGQTKQGLSAESPQQSVDYEILDDGSGWNIDAGAQTQFGIQIKRHFHDMRSAFLYLDSDRDGRISKQELKDICKQWMIPLTEAKRVMKAADLNNDGILDFEEFAQRFDPFMGFQEDSPIETTTIRNPADDRPIGGSSGRYAWPAHEGDMETLTPVIPKETHALESPQESYLRDENATLLRRLAEPCHFCVDLKIENASLRRRIAELEEQLARLQGESAAKAKFDRDSAERERERLQREEEERAAEKARAAARRADEQEALRRQKEVEEQEALRRQKEMEENDEELNTVFVYGRAGSPETADMQKALREAGIPFQNRDYDTDKRYAKALSESGCPDKNPHPPIVILGKKAWWDDGGSNTGDGMFDIPFASSVAMELRNLLGIRAKPKDTSKTMPVRTDADIDTEIAERYLTMQQAFLQMDFDQDGYVTKDELISKCREWNIPISEAQRTICEADMNGDGVLDFDEFAKRFNPLFITKGNNGRGCYRGGAPAPTTYSSPKMVEVIDEDPRDRKERKERRVRKERREHDEYKPSRESKHGDRREHDEYRESRHGDRREHDEYRETRHGDRREHDEYRETRHGDRREHGERREHDDYKPSRESRHADHRKDGEHRDTKPRRPHRSASSSKLK